MAGSGPGARGREREPGELEKGPGKGGRGPDTTRPRELEGGPSRAGVGGPERARAGIKKGAPFGAPRERPAGAGRALRVDILEQPAGELFKFHTLRRPRDAAGVGRGAGYRVPHGFNRAALFRHVHGLHTLRDTGPET